MSKNNALYDKFVDLSFEAITNAIHHLPKDQACDRMLAIVGDLLEEQWKLCDARYDS